LAGGYHDCNGKTVNCDCSIFDDLKGWFDNE
jgi:hypothetical protein